MGQQAKWDAGLYDDKHSFVYKMAEGLLELLAAQPGEKILDIGCGTAHLTAKIAASGAEVTGVDRSPDMIRQAREGYPAIHFEVADATKIPLEGPFDAIFSNATLHWIKAAGESCYRGGTFAASRGPVCCRVWRPWKCGAGGRGTGTSLGKLATAGDYAQSMVLPALGGIRFVAREAWTRSDLRVAV